MRGTDNPTIPQARSYQLDPERFAGARRSMIIRIAVAVPLVLAVIWYMDGRAKPGRDLFDLVALPAIIAWTTYRSIQRESEKWNSMSLEFRDGMLVRRLKDFPPLEIAPNEVTKIVEAARGITIRTNSRPKFLYVNRELLDYEDFRNRLAVWAVSAEVVLATPSAVSIIKSVASMPICIALFGGPLYLIYTPYPRLILPLGLVLVIGFVAMILYYQRSPNVPTSFRRTSWILVALPLFAMIVRFL
jgi:hypothetical protein